MAQLMGGHIDLLSTGMAETVGALEAGDIRVLALSSPKRIKSGPLSKIPTLKESGINTVFINWRGLFGAPGMGKAERDYMAKALKKMVGTKNWKTVCDNNGWTPAYMGPDEFSKFLDKTNDSYSPFSARSDSSRQNNHSRQIGTARHCLAVLSYQRRMQR